MKIFATILLLTLLSASLYAQDEMERFDSLRSAALSQTNDTVKVKKLLTLVDYYTIYYDDLDTVRKYTDMGLNISRQIHDTVGEADFYRLLGWEYSYYDMPEAGDYFFKSLELFEAARNYQRQILTLNDISGYFTNIGKYNLAFDYSQKALKMADEHQCNDFDYIIYNFLGINNYNLGLYGIAKDYYMKSMECPSFSKNDDNVAKQELNIAQCDFQTSQDLYAAVLREEEAYLKEVGKNGDIEDNILVLFSDLLEAYSSIDSLDPRRDTLMMKIEHWLPYMKTNITEYNSTILDSKLLLYYIVKDNRKMADRTAKKLLTEIRHTNFDKTNYNAIVYYYMYTHNWEMAYKYGEMMKRGKQEVTNTELSALNEKVPAEINYRNKVRQEENKARERNTRYEQQMQYNKAARRWMSFAATLITLFIATTLINISRQKRQEAILSSQTEEIKAANEELNTQQNEIVAQNDEIRAQSEELETQRNILSAANASLLSDITYAQKIQRAIVPTAQNLKNMFPESFVLWKPRDIVSGDFYWLHKTDSRKYIVTADCTGHGVPGALLSMLGSSLLNDISVMMDNMTAGQILDLLRSRIVESLSKTQLEVNDGMDMALCIVSGYDLQYAGAKRPLIIARKGEISETKPDKKSICVDRYNLEEGSFKTNNIQLMPGDTLYTFSDGLADQIGGPEKTKKFGNKRLHALLQEVSVQSPDEQYRKIDDTLTSWGATCSFVDDGNPQLDDQLIIGIRIN